MSDEEKSTEATNEESAALEQRPEVIDAAEEPKANRRARRAAEAGADPEDAPIRDRNKRLRAKSAPKTREQRARERADAVAQGLGAGERVDDALSRTATATGKFFEKNFAWVQWLVVAGLIAAIASLIYRYRQENLSEKEGDRLGEVLATSTGKITSTEAPPQADRNLVDTRAEFATATARAEAAEKKWAGLSEHETPELRLWSALARAASFLDLKKWDEAKKIYESTLGDGLATPTIKSRAQEGIGLALEAQGKFAEALPAFEKMGSFGLPDSKNLGRFHAARVRFELGEKDKAKTELEQLAKDLQKDVSPMGPRPYLAGAVEDLQKTIDPKAAAAGAGGISPEQLEELRRQIEAMQQKGGQAP